MAMDGKDLMNLIRLNAGPELALAVTVRLVGGVRVEVMYGGGLPLGERAQCLRMVADALEEEMKEGSPVAVVFVSMSPADLN